MALNDGRVVSNFIIQALKNQPITIYGNGIQTRSFCYVSDMVEGILRVLRHGVYNTPINIGNPEEHTIQWIAGRILELIPESTSKIVNQGESLDDPKNRCPDISKMKQFFGWKPTVSLTNGLSETIAYFREAIKTARLYY